MKTPLIATEKLKSAFKNIREMHERIAAQAPAIEDAISAMDSSVTKALNEDDDKSPMHRLNAYRTTLWAQQGWFPSTWETPLSLISQTAELLGSSQHSQAEEAICSHFQSDRNKLIDSVIENNPDRKDIILDALAAHDEGRYALSIPVFLIQADGIGSSYFNIDSIYTASAGNYEKIKRKFDADECWLRIKYIHYLVGTIHPLNASRRVRDRYDSPFNRHTVIHGESVNYPSRINSLKSISWLHFIGDLAQDKNLAE